MVKKFSTKLAVRQQQPKAKQQEEPEEQPFEEAGSDDISDAEVDSLPSSSEDLHDEDGSGGGSAEETEEGQGDSDLEEFDSEGGEGEEDDDDDDEGEDSLELPDDEFDVGPDDEQPAPSKRKLTSSKQQQDSDSDDGEADEDEDMMQHDDGDDDSGPGDVGQGSKHRQQPKKFSEGEKGASFAKAFAKILQRPVRGLDGTQGKRDTQEGLAGSGDVPLRGAVGDAAILAESKTHIKRQAEEEADKAASRAAKKARLEARRRGRLPVPRRGKDPEHDQREKGLQRLATRGVVMLFNAVTTAKRAQQEAADAGSKVASKVAKASFLAQIQAEPAAPFGGLASLGAGPGGQGGVLGLLGDKKSGAASKRKGQQQQQEEKDEDAPGWQVLQDGFTGLAGRTKMKDWDQKLSDSEGEGAVEGNSDSDGGDDDGW